MNGPTRSPDEQITYEEGITLRQWIILLTLAALACIAIVMVLLA